jgi:hypothetical protein
MQVPILAGEGELRVRMPGNFVDAPVELLVPFVVALENLRNFGGFKPFAFIRKLYDGDDSRRTCCGCPGLWSSLSSKAEKRESR